MSAVIECDDTEVFAESFVTHEPIEICCSGPAVQQHQSWCTLWSGHFSIKSGATSGKVDVLTFGELGNEMLAQPSTFNTVTETLAPFSKVIDTWLPSD